MTDKKMKTIIIPPALAKLGVVYLNVEDRSQTGAKAKALAGLAQSTVAYVKVNDMNLGVTTDGSVITWDILFLGNSGYKGTYGVVTAADPTNVQLNNAIEAAVRQIFLEAEGVTLGAAKIRLLDKFS